MTFDVVLVGVRFSSSATVCVRVVLPLVVES